MEEYDSGSVSDELMERFHIQTRSGAHCAPLVHEHFGTVEQGMVRFSFGHETTIERNQPDNKCSQDSCRRIKRKKMMIIAVAGSGGKTTRVHKLAQYYRSLGKKVFVTTTTHMKKNPIP